MIPSKMVPWQDDEWRKHLAGAVTRVDDLAAAVGLSTEALDWDDDPAFPVRVPRPYLAKMRYGDATDPLLLQVAARHVERTEVDGWTADPLDERSATVMPGLVQKYRGRALVVAATACAVNCRFCFRRHFPYDEHRHDPTFKVLDRVADDPAITEVILSGGDPLTLPDARLETLLRRADAIAHIDRIRIHTRLPAVIPQRINRPLLDILGALRARTTVVVHVNHPNEIDDASRTALEALRAHGVTLLNQGVLLAGVNDDAGTLTRLSHALFEANVLPYYLHMPDAVAGTAHFDVSEDRALMLLDALHGLLPGYLVPRLVREEAGSPAKTILF